MCARRSVFCAYEETPSRRDRRTECHSPPHINRLGNLLYLYTFDVGFCVLLDMGFGMMKP